MEPNCRLLALRIVLQHNFNKLVYISWCIFNKNSANEIFMGLNVRSMALLLQAQTHTGEKGDCPVVTLEIGHVNKVSFRIPNWVNETYLIARAHV